MNCLKPHKYTSPEFNVLGVGARILKILQHQRVVPTDSVCDQLLGQFSSSSLSCHTKKNKIEAIVKQAISFLSLLGVVKFHGETKEIEYIADNKKLNKTAIKNKLADVKDALSDGKNYVNAIVLEAREDKAFKELETVDSNICYLGWERHYREQTILEEKKRLDGELKFDLEETKKLYEQANVYFNGQIESDYKKWIDYEKFRMEDFKSIYRENIARRKLELEAIKEELGEYKTRRKELISFLEEHELFKKFSFIQDELIQMSYMQGKLEACLEQGKECY